MNIATNASWEVDVNDIKLGGEIGRGSFGVVKRGELHGMDVAIKIIAASASVKEKEMAAMMLRREVKALSRCQHQNVVRLIGACSNPPMLILAFAPQGTLRDLLRHRNTELSPSRKMELLFGICDGMAMLHSKGILHLDLKPENILISADGTPWVADFGLAIAMTSTLTGGAGSTKGGRGTMQYKAPEHFADGDSDSDSDEAEGETKPSPKVTYDKPADMYSFAMMAWEIFSGVVPFAGKMDHKILKFHVKALAGGKVKRPSLDAIPSEIAPFIETCWSQDPSARPTFTEAKTMLHAVGTVAIQGALNAPGYWDVFINHSRRCANAVVLATEAATYFRKKGMSVWFDVSMADKSTAAMEEGVKKSKYFIAVISGPCVNNDRPNDDPVGNASFRREYCIKELRWAQEAGKFIQPILRLEDKGNIGNFLGLLDAPLKVDGKMQNISNLRCLGDTEWIDLNRNDNDYWEVGMKKVLRALKAGKERLSRNSQSSGTSSSVETDSSSTVTSSSNYSLTSSTDRATLEKEIKEKMKLEMKKEHIEKMNVLRAKMAEEEELRMKVERKKLDVLQQQYEEKVQEVKNATKRNEKEVQLKKKQETEKVSETYVVTNQIGSSHRIRERPTTDATMVGKLQEGDIVVVTEIRNDWLKIGQNKWTLSKMNDSIYLKKAGDAREKVRFVTHVSNLSSRIRRGPSTATVQVGSLRNCTVPITKISGNWAKLHVDALCLVLGSYKFQDFDINNDGWIMMGEANGRKIFKEDLTATAICGSICYNP